MSWVAAAVVGSSLIGAGVSAYGANKQSKDNAHAQDLNSALQQQQNDAVWTNWLLTRGIASTTGSPIPSGTFPAAGTTRAVNTRLPLWMNVRVAPPTPSPSGGGAAQPFLIRRG